MPKTKNPNYLELGKGPRYGTLLCAVENCDQKRSNTGSRTKIFNMINSVSRVCVKNS